MADISKCQGTGCPLKHSCYRFTAAPKPFWQSYLRNVPVKWKVNTGSQSIVPECEYFWNNVEEEGK